MAQRHKNAFKRIEGKAQHSMDAVVVVAKKKYVYGTQYISFCSLFILLLPVDDCAH